MFDLDPAKILVILVVALLVLGPRELPKVARQAGYVLGELRKIRDRAEAELREAVPDLPPVSTIARSPLTFLTSLGSTETDSVHGTGEASGSPGSSAVVTAAIAPGPDGADGASDGLETGLETGLPPGLPYGEEEPGAVSSTATVMPPSRPVERSGQRAVERRVERAVERPGVPEWPGGPPFDPPSWASDHHWSMVDDASMN